MELPATPTDEIMVLPYGVWRHPWYGQLAIDERDGEECVANFAANVYLQKIPIECAWHMATVEGAAGWYTSLRSGDKGVYATIEWNRLGTELIGDRRFRYHSPEVYLRSAGQKWVRPSDSQPFSNLIVGDSLVNQPFFKELGEIGGQFAEPRVGPTIFRVPLVQPAAEGEREMADQKTQQQGTPNTSEAPVTAASGGGPSPAEGVAQIGERLAAMEAELGKLRAENADLTTARQQDQAALQATQSQLLRASLEQRVGALRFGDKKAIYIAPAVRTRIVEAALMVSDEAPAMMSEGDEQQPSVRELILTIVADLPGSLVEGGERGIAADGEQILDAAARYEAAVVKAMADRNIERPAAMSVVNAAEPALAKDAGLG